MASQDAQPPTGPIGMCGAAYYSSGLNSAVSDSIVKPLLTWLYTGPDHKTTKASGADGKKGAGASPAVRFASVDEEIAPDESLESLDALSPSQNVPADGSAQLKQLSETLQGTHLQERRMSHFAFEPVSLPASRVRFPHFLFVCTFSDIEKAAIMCDRASGGITK